MCEVNVEKMLQGDSAEFAKFVQQNFARVSNIVYWNAYNKESCEDIVQEIFFQLFRSVKNFRGHSKFSTWFYGLIKNTIRQQNRKVWKVSTREIYLEDTFFVGDTNDHVEPEKVILVSEQVDALMKSIARLSRHHQEVLFLTLLKGYTYEEVAAILECPVGTIKSRLFYARKALKEMMQHAGMEEDVLRRREN